jgi:hypothetical protein
MAIFEVEIRAWLPGLLGIQAANDDTYQWMAPGLALARIHDARFSPLVLPAFVDPAPRPNSSFSAEA